MITKQTVLILGAGASHAFDFPVGGELVQRLHSGLQNGAEAFRCLNEQLSHPVESIQQFDLALKQSSPLSVDSFLEHREDLRTIGKQAIAACLIPFENPNALHKLGLTRRGLIFSLTG